MESNGEIGAVFARNNLRFPQDHHFHLFGEAIRLYLEGINRLQAVLAQFAQKLLHARQLAKSLSIVSIGFIVHRNHVARFDSPRHSHGLLCINSVDPAHRQEEDVHTADLIDHRLGQLVPQVAQVADPHAVNHDRENKILSALLAFLLIVIGKKAEHRNAPHLILTQLIDHERFRPSRRTRHSPRLVVITVAVRNRYHVRADIRQFEPDRILIRIRHRRTVFTFEFEARMAVIGYCHILYDTILDTSFIMKVLDSKIMKKEAIIAVLIGLFLGLFITYGVYKARTSVSKESSTTNLAISSLGEQTSGGELVVNNPLNESVQNEDTVSVSGTTAAQSFVVIFVGTEETITTSDASGNFSVEVELEDGSNIITVTVINEDGQSFSVERIVIVSDEEFEEASASAETE